MIPNDVDPSLCAAEPLLDSLDDGFSPPARQGDASAPAEADPGEPGEPVLGPKSPF